MVNVWRHLNVRTGEDINILPHTEKQVKPEKSFVANHLLVGNHSAFYDNFSIQTRENRKFLQEVKERLLIMRVKPSLNSNIILALLYLYNRPQ